MAASSDGGGPSGGDGVLRVLIASDTHLGYAERDPIRKDDSFESFAEVFKLANEHRVDMVLLAGDLFHDNKPSRRALQRCMEIMREHCLGNRPVELEVVSDQQSNFHCQHRQGRVNFEDPNYNVQLPVFSIHGNHDDPAGDGGLAPLDLMSTANLINYFGRCDNFEKVELRPILIRKGETRLALYGLGHVRDERLARCFDLNRVRLSRPVEDRDKWFNVFALHQNRMPRGAGVVAKGYIKDSQVPAIMDLVVWGHEHECCIGGGMGGLTESAGHNFTVIQPGSTVATALVEGEAKPKHVALLSLYGDQWQMTPLPLRTVRPFVMGDVCLKDHEDDPLVNLHDEASLMDFLAERVETLLAPLAAQSNGSGDAAEGSRSGAKPAGKLPLVRLRVDYDGYTTCNPQRFGQRFVDRVANPADILLFQRTKIKRRLEREAADAKKRAKSGGGENGGAAANMEDEGDGAYDPAQSAAEILRLMNDFMSTGKDALRLLPPGELNAALFHEFVARDNKSAIRNSVETMLKRTQAFLASESRPALDAEGSRKDKEAALEKQLQLYRDAQQAGPQPHDQAAAPAPPQPPPAPPRQPESRAGSATAASSSAAPRAAPDPMAESLLA